MGKLLSLYGFVTRQNPHYMDVSPFRSPPFLLTWQAEWSPPRWVAGHGEPERGEAIPSQVLIPTVLVTATLPDGKPSGSISKAPFEGSQQEGLRIMSPDVHVRAMG